MARISAEDFRNLLESIVATLPEGCASLKFSESEGGVFHVLVKPEKGGAAEMRAVFNGHGVALFFGRGAVFEVPLKGMRYTNLPCLEEVRALCSGVIAGRFEEIVTSVGSKIVGARAKIDLADDVASGVWREFPFFPFRKRKKEHLKYSPYC